MVLYGLLGGSRPFGDGAASASLRGPLTVEPRPLWTSPSNADDAERIADARAHQRRRTAQGPAWRRGRRRRQGDQGRSGGALSLGARLRRRPAAHARPAPDRSAPGSLHLSQRQVHAPPLVRRRRHGADRARGGRRRGRHAGQAARSRARGAARGRRQALPARHVRSGAHHGPERRHPGARDDRERPARGRRRSHRQGVRIAARDPATRCSRCSRRSIPMRSIRRSRWPWSSGA